MTHEILIYGDIVPFKWWGDSEYDLADLNNALSSLTIAEGDDILVQIHTFGGCTTTAFAMYNKLLNFKTKNNCKLNTRVDGYCCSSGVILLLAGDERIGNQYAEPFIHNAWTWTMGDKNEHKKQYEELLKVDNQIATLYAERTNIDKTKALELMAAENFVSPEDALAFGFYTKLENVYAAENTYIFNSLRIQNNQNRQKIQNNMSEKNKKSTWNKIKSDIDAFFNGTKNKIVFTADNSELDFYELGDDDTPKAKDGETAGDKAKFDGKPAGESNNGEYVMPSGETYKFEGEELIEIIAKEEEGDSETEALKTENSELKTENKTLKEEIKNLKAEKVVLNTKLNKAEKIMKNFKEEMEDDEEDEEDPVPEKRRNSKNNPSGKRNLFKYVN